MRRIAAEVGALRGPPIYLAVAADLSDVVEGLPPHASLVVAINTSHTTDRRVVVGPQSRAALGDRLWVTFVDDDDSVQMVEDTLLTAYLAVGLLHRGRPVVLFASRTVAAERLAAAVLLVRGLSQPQAIAAVRELRSNAFAEVDDEIALAAIDEAHRARETFARNGVRNSL